MRAQNLVILIFIAIGWGVVPFLLKKGAIRAGTPATAMLYCGGIGAFAVAIALYHHRQVTRQLRALRPATVLLMACAAAMGIFCTYYFIDNLGNPEQHTATVVLVTYCLPVIIAGVIASVLYKQAITPVGYAAALVTLASIYVFAIYGMADNVKAA